MHYTEGQLLSRKETAVEEMQPYEAEYDECPTFDYAPYVRLAVCPDHGLEAVVRERHYNTGYDNGVAGEFACGEIVVEDVF